MNVNTPPLASWYKNNHGQYIFMQEKKELGLVLPEIRGFFLLQLGCSEQKQWLDPSPIKRRILLSGANGLEPHSSIQGSYTLLPFRDESIDLVLLPHVLETETEPKAILAESWRVLVAGGTLILLNFNPWGLPFLLKKRYLPLIKHFHSAQRLRLWLMDLDAEILQAKNFCYRFPSSPIPLNKPHWLDQLGHYLLPYAGCINLIVAKKKVAAVTPIKPRWQWEKIPAPKGLAEPTAGSVRRG